MCSYECMTKVQWVALQETFPCERKMFLDISPSMLHVNMSLAITWREMVEKNKFTVLGATLEEKWVRAAHSLASAPLSSEHQYITDEVIEWCMIVLCQKLGIESVSCIKQARWPSSVCYVDEKTSTIHSVTGQHIRDHVFKNIPNMFVVLNVILENAMVTFKPRREKEVASALEDVARPSSPPSSPTKKTIKQIIDMTSVCETEQQWHLLEKALFIKRYVELYGSVRIQYEDQAELDNLTILFPFKDNYTIQNDDKQLFENSVLVRKF